MSATCCWPRIASRNAFESPVRQVMTTKVRTVDRRASIDDLMPIFDAGLVAIVSDEGGFHGLITRIDVLNFLRKQPAGQITMRNPDEQAAPRQCRPTACFPSARPATPLRHPRDPCRPIAGPDDRRSDDADLHDQHIQAAIAGRAQGLDYGRSHNPTRWAFERCVADLEDGQAGFAFASGMAAIATVLELLESGSHVVASDDLYGGTYRLFERVRRSSAALTVTYVDPSDPRAIEAAIKPNTGWCGSKRRAIRC